MKRTPFVALALALLLGAPRLVVAQEPPEPPRPARPPEPPEPPMRPARAPRPPEEDTPERRKELRRRIAAVRMARLTQELDLDEETAAKLFPLLNRHEEKVAALAEERGELMRTLRKLSEGKSTDDAAALGKALDRIAEIEHAIHELDETTQKRAREILKPTQMARFIVFHERFHDEVRDLIHESRRGPEPGEAPVAQDPAGRVKDLLEHIDRLAETKPLRREELARTFNEVRRTIEQYSRRAGDGARESIEEWHRRLMERQDLWHSLEGEMRLEDAKELLGAMERAAQRWRQQDFANLQKKLEALTEELGKTDREDLQRAAEKLRAHAKALQERFRAQQDRERAERERDRDREPAPDGKKPY